MVSGEGSESLDDIVGCRTSGVALDHRESVGSQVLLLCCNSQNETLRCCLVVKMERHFDFVVVILLPLDLSTCDTNCSS